MIYVFDTSSFSRLKHFFPAIFKTIWTGLDALVTNGSLISTREVLNEIERGEADPMSINGLKPASKSLLLQRQMNCALLRRSFRSPTFKRSLGKRHA